MNLHDENKPCNDCLLEDVDYSIRAYVLNDRAKSFHRWYSNVFSGINRPMADDFVFSITTFDGQDFLEVASYNPHFGVNALQQLFFSYEQQRDYKPKLVESKKDPK